MQPDGQLDESDRSLMRAVAHTSRDDGPPPSTRAVAQQLTSAGGAVAAGTEPWWGLEQRARDLERRGLLTVLSVRDELKSPAQSMRTTDDYGLALTEAGRALIEPV